MNAMEKFHIQMGCGEPLQSRSWVVRSVAQTKNQGSHAVDKPVVHEVHDEPCQEGKRRS